LVAVVCLLHRVRHESRSGSQGCTLRAQRSNGIQVSSSIAVGHPAEKILECAQKIGADLVIIGQRGASKFEEISLGSVSERILGYADCPVLLTR
jgi:nucleotide-binding universal stress UspA family protein